MVAKFGGQATLGTADNNPLALVVGGYQAILLLPAVDSIYGSNPNVVTGSGQNAVTNGVVGATIAGGGGCNPGTGGTCTTATANQVTALFGTVGGGSLNTAGKGATIAGGYGNTASGISSTVAGGKGNMATGNYSTVAGGQNNTASGLDSYSTVAGGQNNTASGFASTVAGGEANLASGIGSFAAGTGAYATDDYSFVWSDGSGIATSQGANTFQVLATGGIGLYPGGAQVGIFWGSGWSCTVNTGSNWACSSDRHLKENFQTLNLRDVLRHVVEMPVTSWTVIGHPDWRHIGPVAQDFHATFGLGDPNDDTHIDIGDSQGVALAAIKGLNAKVEDQAATIRDQQHEIAELSERVQKAETLAADVVALKAALAELQRGRETVAVK